MKRIDGSLGKHLDAVHLSRQDLEHVESLLRKVATRVTYRHNDFEFDNIDELANCESGILSKLEVRSRNPDISVDFGNRNVWLYTSSNDLAARGVYAELRHFLEDRCIRAVSVRKSVLDTLGMLGVIVGTFALIERQFLEAAMAWAAAPITLGLQLFSPSRSRIEMSNSQQSFWARNRDNLIIGIVASAVVSLAVAVIQLAFSNGKG